MFSFYFIFDSPYNFRFELSFKSQIDATVPGSTAGPFIFFSRMVIELVLSQEAFEKFKVRIILALALFRGPKLWNALP